MRQRRNARKANEIIYMVILLSTIYSGQQNTEALKKFLTFLLLIKIFALFFRYCK